jgi:hypothetical protein
MPGERFGLTALREFCSVKRYSDFHAFDSEVSVRLEYLSNGAPTGRTKSDGRLCGQTEFISAKLPPKRLWPMRQSVVDERKEGLCCFLQAFERCDASLPRQLLLDFLLPETQPDLLQRVPSLSPRTRHHLV